MIGYSCPATKAFVVMRFADGEKQPIVTVIAKIALHLRGNRL